MSTATGKVLKEATVKKVQDQLDCAFCLQTYCDPKLLSCFHVFCAHCLTQLVVNSGDGSTITCPKCRQPTPLLQCGVTGLQSAFHIHRLIDIRNTLEKVQEPQKAQCENAKCNKATATGFCRDCGRLVCKTCTTAHEILGELASHQIVSIASIQGDTTRLIPLKRKVMYCPKHQEKKAKIFCETCQELICTDCTIRLHKNHQYDLVTDVYPKHRDEILAELKTVRQHLQSVKTALLASDTRRQEICDQRHTIEADIHRRIDQLHQALDQRSTELVGQLDQITQKKLQNLAAQKDQIELFQNHLSRCLEYVEGSLKTGTEGEILAMKAPLVRQIQQMVPEIKPDTLYPQEIADMFLVEDDAPKVTEACQQLAAITSVDPKQCYSTGDGLKKATVGENSEVTLHTRNEYGQPGFVQTADVTVELVCSRDSTTVECNTTNAEDSKCLIQYQPITRGKHQLHITIGGRQTKGSPHTVVVQQRLGTLGKPIKVVSDLRKPWGVAINSKGMVIVAENGENRVTVFTPEGEKLRSFGSEGKGDGELNFPCGVTVDEDDNIYVVDNRNCRIQKFTPNGEHISSVGSQGGNQLQFKYPVGIGFNRRKGIYVCDNSNHRVQILDTNFVFLNQFGSRGNGDGQFINPWGVAFDSDENVYIVDSNNHRIQVFTPEGQYVRQFGGKGGGHGKLSFPSNIAIVGDRVYITELDNYRVSIFTTAGQFVHRFGSRGQSSGQLNAPWGIAVDDSDFIVSDRDNNRVHFY